MKPVALTLLPLALLAMLPAEAARPAAHAKPAQAMTANSQFQQISKRFLAEAMRLSRLRQPRWANTGTTRCCPI